jgi:hypothetical protein
MRPMIGNRYECQCCGRTARITKRYDGGYEYEFEEEHRHTRWISKADATLRFHRVEDIDIVHNQLAASLIT